ncbi:MAG: fibronectin type III domain-containing protein [Acidobacteriaceae bacterium]|nr:fibronectin type III domain-containing protein [Acidobacteriaceae bacterium]
MAANYTDQLTASLLSNNPLAEFFYAVSVLNPNGRTAGLSNRVAVPAVIALPPPADLHSQPTATGIVLSWNGEPHTPETPQLRHLYRVYRREAGAKVDSIVGEVPLDTARTYSLVDQSFDWEKTYEYRATVVQVIHLDTRAEQQFEGTDSAPLRVFAHDIFPPAVPSGLQAVFSGPGQQTFVDLIWTPDTDPDLAGYNIYRHESEAPEQKINSELLKTPAFRDNNVLPGHTYVYSVSAVDVRGNESAHSEIASETVH